MTASMWRKHARKVIEQTAVQAQLDGCDKDETLKRIDAAYPFGERKYHPYQIWLSERKRWIAGQGVAEARTAKGSEREQALLAAWNSGEPIR